MFLVFMSISLLLHKQVSEQLRVLVRLHLILGNSQTRTVFFVVVYTFLYSICLAYAESVFSVLFTWDSSFHRLNI